MIPRTDQRSSNHISSHHDYWHRGFRSLTSLPSQIAQPPTHHKGIKDSTRTSPKANQTGQIRFANHIYLPFPKIIIIIRSHEGLDVYRPVSNPDPSRPLWGNNQWPSEQDVPQFQQKFERWVGRMKELGAIVIEA